MVASKGLGRGLSALISENRLPVRSGEGEAGKTLKARLIALNTITPGSAQTRRHFAKDELAQLAQSIKANGVIQPVLVRATSPAAEKFELIAGERRWRAAQLAGLEAIPAITLDISNKQALEISLIENIQRENLNPVEEAEGYRRLCDEFSYTQEALADALGKSRSHIANTLRLLHLPEAILHTVREGKLSAGHARALLASKAPEDLATRVIKEGLSVRQTEALVQEEAAGTMELTPAAVKKDGRRKDAALLAWEQNLKEHYGVPVTISGKGEKGSIRLSYRTAEEREQLLQKLGLSA